MTLVYLHFKTINGFTEHYFLVEWPSGHSDPAKLKETAKEARQLSPEELKSRQIELQVRFIKLMV